MNLSELLQRIPAPVRAWLYAALAVILVVQQFFGWPGGSIGQGIIKLGAAAGMIIAVGNVDTSR